MVDSYRNYLSDACVSPRPVSLFGDKFCSKMTTLSVELLTSVRAHATKFKDFKHSSHSPRSECSKSNTHASFVSTFNLGMIS